MGTTITLELKIESGNPETRRFYWRVVGFIAHFLASRIGIGQISAQKR